jgi:exopolysaccharide production protein ExoQ
VNSQIALVGCVAVIGALFMLDRDRPARTSIALWIPFLWLLIAGSRNASEWLQLSEPIDSVDRYLEGSPVDRGVLTVLLAFGAITLAGRGRRVGTILRANRPIVVFFLYCGVSILWSEYPFVGFKRFIRALGDMVVILVILTDPNGRAALKRLFARVGFLFLPLSLLFIRYYPEWGRAYGVDGSVYWTGVAAGKNGLGMICLIFGLASVWRFLIAYEGRGDRHRMRLLVAHGAAVAMTLWLLWIADSKTSLCCFLLASSLMTVMTFTTLARKPAVLHCMVATIVSVSFFVLFLGVGKGVLETMGRDPTLTGRTDVWKLVLKFADNPLLGSGFESFWMGARLKEICRLNGGINQAHNGYIETYLNLGWVGLMLLAVLIVIGYRNVITGLRSEPDVGKLKLAYVLVGVIYNFTEGSFKMMSPVWIAFLLASTAVPTNTRRPAAAALGREPRYSDEGWWTVSAPATLMRERRELG